MRKIIYGRIFTYFGKEWRIIMSAIWGAIDISGCSIQEDKKKILRDAFDKCVIDRYEEMGNENVYMGCGIQYFVPEAEYEKLPMFSEDIYFTADAIIDNREELMDKYNVIPKKDIVLTDAELIYEIYKKYGKSCLNDLLGAYVFVWYDKKKNKIEVVSDAVGNRCVYYRIVDNVFYFSSLIEPLAKISLPVSNNDRWFADYLAYDYLVMFTEAEETQLKDIYRVAPSQWLEYDGKKINKEIYWDILKDKKEYRFSSDNEYKKKFNEVWQKAVKGTLRTDSNISILLSGGYDSNSVLAVAAPYLKSKDRKIYSYTSVPREDYQVKNKGFDVENEREDVEATAKFYGNIITDYIDLDGKNAWELLEKEYDSMEMPFKSIQNFMWIKEAAKRAYKNNSRLMLSGFYGNISISFTNLPLYFNSLYMKRRYIKLLKEIKSFAKTQGFSGRYALKKIREDCKASYEENKDIYEGSFVNRQLADSLKSNERLMKEEKIQFKVCRNYEACRGRMAHLIALRQIGESEMKNSLATGVLFRDPTKDKRVLEFCAHLPLNQYCKNGIERRLVKVYLKDIMPPHIIDIRKKGRQSADLHYRFSFDWENVQKEWILEYDKYKNSKYVDIDAAQKQLKEKTDLNSYSAYELTRHMFTLIALRYEHWEY